jgi:hypothetical protein
LNKIRKIYFTIIHFFFNLIFQDTSSCGSISQPCSSVDFAVSRLAVNKGDMTILIEGRADLSNAVKLDDIVLRGDGPEGTTRDVYVHQTATVQTPGYIYITKLKVTEIENVKFILSGTKSYWNGVVKPLIHTEGGSSERPVTLKNDTFTMVSGSTGSLLCSVIEIDDGTIVIMGCTFSDMRMNLASNSVVIGVSKASVVLSGTEFRNIELDGDSGVVGSQTSECEWGLHSVVVLNEAVTTIKDTVMRNTYGGIIINGGSADVENTLFDMVGRGENPKYPSAERHLKCGM